MNPQGDRHRLVADAILLERAERVLARRYPEHFLLIRETRRTLARTARAWREQAGDRRPETVTEFLERTQKPPGPLDTDEGRKAFCDALLRKSEGDLIYDQRGEIPDPAQ